jgi:methylornithine synthase
MMISPGLLPEGALVALQARGACWYALYQEAHRPQLYARLRRGQPYAARVAARQAARRAGLLVEDGILTGVGDTAADRARSISAMRRDGSEQVRVMSFVPQRGTPLAAAAAPSYDAELLTIAVMRLAMPERFIPASLDVAGLDGLEPRLNAGANVVTSIVPPHSGLLGVSRAELGVDEGERTVASVLPRLASLGLRSGSVEQYRERLVRLASRPLAAAR